MTAQTQGRQRDFETWGSIEFVLTGQHVYYGSAAMGFLSGANAGKVTKPAGAAGTLAQLIELGIFTEEVDATSADATATVRLQKEIEIEWWANDGTITAANVFGVAYRVDDQTVSAKGNAADGSAPRSKAGRIWAVDATLGAAVEVVRDLSVSNKPLGVLPAPVAADIIPVEIVNGAIYDGPVLAANSTLTLPAAPPDGVSATILYDGVKNGFTLQVRDATGPTNLTAALTASKRLRISVESLGGKWFAGAAVAP